MAGRPWADLGQTLGTLTSSQGSRGEGPDRRHRPEALTMRRGRAQPCRQRRARSHITLCQRHAYSGPCFCQRPSGGCFSKLPFSLLTGSGPCRRRAKVPPSGEQFWENAVALGGRRTNRKRIPQKIGGSGSEAASRSTHGRPKVSQTSQNGAKMAPNVARKSTNCRISRKM